MTNFQFFIKDQRWKIDDWYPVQQGRQWGTVKKVSQFFHSKKEYTIKAYDYKEIDIRGIGL